MAIPMISGVEQGMALSNALDASRQGRANIRGTQLDNLSKRQAIEDFMLDAERRKAERELGTQTALSQTRQLPSAERAAISGNQFKTMTNQEEMSPLSQEHRKISKRADILAAKVKEDNPQLYTDWIKSGMQSEMAQNFMKMNNSNRSVYMNTFAPVERAIAKGVKGSELKSIYENAYYKFAQNRQNDQLFSQLKHPDDFDPNTFGLMYGAAIQSEEAMIARQQAAAKFAQDKEMLGREALFESTQAERDHQNKMEQIELAGLLGMKEAQIRAGTGQGADAFNQELALKLAGDPEKGTGMAKNILQDAINQFGLMDKDGNQFTDDAMNVAATTLFNDASERYQQLAELKLRSPQTYEDLYGDYSPSYNTAVKQLIQEKVQSGAFKAEFGYNFGKESVIPGAEAMAGKRKADAGVVKSIRLGSESAAEDMFENITNSLVDQANIGEELAEQVTYTNEAAMGANIEDLYDGIYSKSGVGRSRKLTPHQSYRRNRATQELRKFRNTPMKGVEGSHKERMAAQAKRYLKEEKRVTRLYTTMELLSRTPEFKDSPAFATASPKAQHRMLQTAAETLLPTLK